MSAGMRPAFADVIAAPARMSASFSVVADAIGAVVSRMAAIVRAWGSVGCRVGFVL